MTTLGYALLSLLAREPRSGYDLTVLLKGHLSFLWQASHSQIYPELARLEQDRLIEHELIAQADRPDKKIYTITSSGLEALKQWVVQPAVVQPVRDELVLKAFCLWLVDSQAAIGLFQERVAYYDQQLATYEALLIDVERRWNADARQLSSPWFGTYAILRRGIAATRSNSDWCQWILEQLNQ